MYKSCQVPQDTQRCLSGAEGVPISVLLCLITGALCGFERRCMGQIGSRFLAISFLLGYLGLCFIDDHRSVVGTASLARLRKIYVATGV